MVFAHDFWIEPSNFFPRTSESVGVRLREGEHLVGDILPMNPPRVQQFIVRDAVGSRSIARRRGAEPAGGLRVSAPGLQIIGYYTHPYPLQLPGDKFTAYLREEGLESIIALRALRNETGKEGREIFYRCAKSLLQSGAVIPTEGDRSLGFPLELVAEQNPYALVVGQKFSVRLTYAQKPLAGALVIALNSLNPADKQAMRSDVDGRATFDIDPDKAGLWLVKAVHMVPAPKNGIKDAEDDADWASYWASLTFAVANPEKTTPTPALK
ncbi:MAG: DUF4198 domain-containing protein [Betaproteobacteria bacterium]|nr:DUF4198 domain-containing protein [Betaproteobacteria bacterium]